MRPDHAPSPDPPRCAQMRRDEASILPLSLSPSPSPSLPLPLPLSGRRRRPLPREDCRGVRREVHRHRRRLEDVRESPRVAEMSTRCRREITTSTVPWGMVTRLRFGLTSSSAASQRRLSGVWAVPAAPSFGPCLPQVRRARAVVCASGGDRAFLLGAHDARHRRAAFAQGRETAEIDRRETAERPPHIPSRRPAWTGGKPQLRLGSSANNAVDGKDPAVTDNGPHPRASHPPAGCPPSPRPSPDHFPQASTSSTSFSTRRSPTRQRRRDPTTPRLRPTPSPRAARRADGTMPAHKGCGRVHHRPPPPQGGGRAQGLVRRLRARPLLRHDHLGHHCGQGRHQPEAVSRGAAGLALCVSMFRSRPALPAVPVSYFYVSHDEVET